MVCLGIDPDSQYVALAVGSSQDILAVHSHKIKGTRKDTIEPVIRALRIQIPAFMKSLHLDDVWPSRIVVEGQRIYAGSKAQPNDLIKLAKIAGAAAGICAMLYPDKHIIIPDPRDWKGSVPKHVYQARLYKQLGWGYVSHKSANYAHPKNPTAGRSISHGEWKHAGDACGLSMWGASLDLKDLA
jgi:hypothetical protein